MWRYLRIERSIPSSAFLPLEAASRTTVENAWNALFLLYENLVFSKHTTLHIITSDFHLPRAAIIFNHVFASSSLTLTYENAGAGEEDPSVLGQLKFKEVRPSTV